MKDDVSPNPIDVRALRSATVMLRANRLTNSIEQLRRTSRRDCKRRSLGAHPLHDSESSRTTMASSTPTGQQRGNLKQPRRRQRRSAADRAAVAILACRTTSRTSRHREHREHRDLTRTEDGRNVDAFVVAISRHPPRSVSDQRGARFALVALRASAGSTRSPGRGMKVAAGTKQPETARGQLRATGDERPALTTAVRLQSPPHGSAPRMGPVNSKVRAPADGSSTSEISSQRPRQRMRRRH
jgi:hypothetical protein